MQKCSKLASIYSVGVVSTVVLENRTVTNVNQSFTSVTVMTVEFVQEVNAHIDAVFLIGHNFAKFR